MESVLKATTKIDNVEEAYMVYGVYDICVKVKARLPQDLKGIV
jgi:DNA-binding Lrp family transcriptional regulator